MCIDRCGPLTDQNQNKKIAKETNGKRLLEAVARGGGASMRVTEEKHDREKIRNNKRRGRKK